MTSHLEKLSCSKEQRTPPRKLASLLACSPAGLPQVPCTHSMATERPRMYSFPRQRAVRPRVAAWLPVGTQTLDAYVGVVLTVVTVKPTPGVICVKKAITEAMRQSKHLHQTLQIQSQRKRWEPSQQSSIFLRMAQINLSSYKVHSTASDQKKEQTKSLLKTLSAAIMQLTHRTQALLALGRQKIWSWWPFSQGKCYSPVTDFAFTAESQALSKTRADRQASVELAGSCR